MFNERSRGAIAILVVVLAAGLLAACPPLVTPPLGDPGIAVSPLVGLVTTEAGGTATFTVVLNTQPAANVTIALSSSDTSEGTVSPASLTFTSADWSSARTVTATGIDDVIPDGDQLYSIVTASTVSSDPGYDGLDPADVLVANTDNDAPGMTVSPQGGLVTTEAAGTATFTVVLNTQPAANVTIALSSSDTSEGTVSPASLTFTTVNWNIAQTVTATGVDDLVADGNQPYSIVTASASSGDPGYDGLDPADPSVINTDDEPSPGIAVSPVSGLMTTEAGGTATFTVVLNTQPTANVAIGLSSSDTSEGTVSPASLTFTTANWNSAQTVTATGVDDLVADGNQPYSIVTASPSSSDPGYNGLDPADPSVTNTDNDAPGITVAPASGLVTTEAGGTAAFTVVLNTQPTANVAIGLSSSDTSEGTVSPASLTFTTANWNSAQTVTATGVDDLVADGNQPYSIVTASPSSSDPGYNGMNAADVSVTNSDNDSTGITVSPASGLLTTEAGGTATFTVALNTQPLANVTIGLSSSDTTEGTVSPASLTFASANWNITQTVTVTGVDDLVADGNQPYSIVTAAAISADPGYNGLNPADVSVTNADNEPSAGVTVSPVNGLVTTEAGGTATFTVVLKTQPIANVTIALSSSDTTEGTVSPASLTFTTASWNVAQTVTLAGVDDLVADGNQPYSIVTAAAISGDPGYNGQNPADVSATNADNESSPGITVNPISGLVTTEAGGTAIFTMVLKTQPTASVTIGLTSGDTTEGTVSPAGLTFTTANWNIAQTVTATGVDDAIADGNQPYSIVTAPATSADPGYNGLNPANVAVTNTDNEPARGITVNPTTGLVTTEAGGTAGFTVVLNAPPGASVTIGVSSSDTTEGTVSPASLTFTTANWSVAQAVTVTGVDDAIADGLQRYSLVTAPASSADTGYNGMDPADVSVTNTDNEPPLPIGNTTWMYDFTTDGHLIPGSAWYADLVDAGETPLGYWLNQSSIAPPQLFTGDFAAEFEFYLKALPGENINRYAFRLIDPNWANIHRKFASFGAYFTAFPVAHPDAYYDESQGNGWYSYEAHPGSVAGVVSGVNTCRITRIGDTVTVTMNGQLAGTIVVDPLNLPTAGYAPLVFGQNSGIEADSNFYVRKLTVMYYLGERMDHAWN